MRTATSLLVLLSTVAFVQALPPDAKKSADSVTAFRQAINSPSHSLDELATRDFASVPLTKTDAALARSILWHAHVAKIKADRAAEVKDRVLKWNRVEMPFDYKTFGEKPVGGHSLWISLHGGGNTTSRANDRQYENQKKLYTLIEGIYLAPRAPTNTWNLWHEAHIDILFTRLIEDLIVLEEVNPDRVYVLGYSAGGDGVYQLGPRMADSWAAASMMAGHPNGVSLLSLRNCPFSIQVGGSDSAYGRNQVCKEYGEKLDQLQKDDPFGYVHAVKIHEGKPHWMGGEDKAALPWLAKFTRDPIPSRVVWKQTSVPHHRFYWLAVPTSDAKKDDEIVAEYKGQVVEIAKAEPIGKVIVRLDDRMMNLDEPVIVRMAGRELFNGPVTRSLQTMIRTLSGRGDPRLLFDAEVAVTIPNRK